MGSQIVYIRRRPNNSKLPDDLYYESNRKIGASFKSGSRDVLRGLTPEEEEKYLPEILGVGVNETGWRQAKKDFWCEISLIIESGEGTALEIGLDSQGEPINLKDWIDFRFAQKHSDVASAEDALADNYFCKYYIFDPASKQKKALAGMAVLKAARTEFLKMSNNDEKMRMTLRLLGFDTRKLDSGGEAAELALDTFVEKIPDKFLEVATDADLEMKSFIEECVSNNVLEKIGNVLMDGDLTVGHNQKEAVVYLKDPKNSKVLTTLKARLAQAS